MGSRKKLISNPLFDKVDQYLTIINWISFYILITLSTLYRLVIGSKIVPVLLKIGKLCPEIVVMKVVCYKIISFCFSRCVQIPARLLVIQKNFSIRQFVPRISRGISRNSWSTITDFLERDTRLISSHPTWKQI